MTNIIDGKKISEEILANLKNKIAKLGKIPGLAVIIIGNNKASNLYIKKKQEACAKTGIYSEKYELEENIREEQVIGLIKSLNSKTNIHGILVQLPIPKHINTDNIVNEISPFKDVDGLNPLNLGRLLIGNESLAPCTPEGIVYLLERVTSLEGKNIVIINHSNIIGKPLSLMLLNRNATVTVCHVKTKGLAEHTRDADILVTATGVPNLIKKEMVKKGVIIIDAGISYVDGKLRGDVDFDNVKDKCSYITPVPGGVGPMTVAMLMENCYKSCKMLT